MERPSEGSAAVAVARQLTLASGATARCSDPLTMRQANFGRQELLLDGEIQSARIVVATNSTAGGAERIGVETRTEEDENYQSTIYPQCHHEESVHHCIGEKVMYRIFLPALGGFFAWSFLGVLMASVFLWTFPEGQSYPWILGFQVRAVPPTSG